MQLYDYMYKYKLCNPRLNSPCVPEFRRGHLCESRFVVRELLARRTTPTGRFETAPVLASVHTPPWGKMSFLLFFVPLVAMENYL